MKDEIFGRLNAVVGNVTANRTQVKLQLAQATAATNALDDDVRDACNLLIAKLVHPQSVSQVVTSAFQASQLQKTLDEMDALIAAVQIAQEQPELVAMQMSVNEEVSNSPQQSAAPGASNDASLAADEGDGQASEAAAEASEASAAE